MPNSPRHHEHHPVDGLLAHSVVDPADLIAEAQLIRARRRRQRTYAAFVAFIVFSIIAVITAQVGFSDTSPSTGTAPKIAVNAEALGVLVIRPGRDPERVAAATPVVGASVREVRSSARWALEGVASVERSATEATVAVRTRSARSVATVERIDLFAGRIQITGAAMRASATSVDGRASGAVTVASTAKLLVDGAAVPLTPNRKVAVQGVGTVLLNEQAVVASSPSGDAQTGPRYRVVGAIAHVRLTTATAGLPAGTEVIIGRVDAGVREGKVRAVPHPAPGTNPGDAAPPSTGPVNLQPGAPRPGETTVPRRSVDVRSNPSTAGSAAGLQGYLFPVLGRHDYSNDYGAPRASTGVPHQGNDIFADEGTPLVAVSDGVLDRVGWNPIGGYRFWLFDEQGNSFYYAHLSAYSPIAQDGARVRRGDVIGFVGHTGDAQGTPPHLHFEVHPGNGAPTNPFPFLNAWKQGIAVSIGLISGGAGDKVAPLSLLGFTDIAPNSGLQGSVLDSVPDTTARPIEQEHSPVDPAASLKGAIEGPGTSRQ